jgi:hypothetical protein
MYPPRSGEGLEEVSLDLMAHLDLEREREISGPVNQRSCPGVWGEVLGDPRDMAKAGLLEPQRT